MCIYILLFMSIRLIISENHFRWRDTKIFIGKILYCDYLCNYLILIELIRCLHTNILFDGAFSIIHYYEINSTVALNFILSLNYEWACIMILSCYYHDDFSYDYFFISFYYFVDPFGTIVASHGFCGRINDSLQ